MGSTTNRTTEDVIFDLDNGDLVALCALAGHEAITDIQDVDVAELTAAVEERRAQYDEIPDEYGTLDNAANFVNFLISF